MKIFESIEHIEKPLENAVITIGNFDGVHIGHQALFHTVIEKAELLDGASVAMTFDPHPMRILEPDNRPPLITLYEQKKELIARAGLDVLICVPFTKTFAAVTARDFVEQLLIKRIGMRAIVIGKDYTFGRHREGNLAYLKELSRELQFDVLVVDWIQDADKVSDRISSTNIREMVTEGRMEEARKMLGRHYQVRGRVASGRNRGGRLLGFPTANLHLQDELCPKQGIYAVTVEHQGHLYQGVANIGYSPTFDDHIFTIEVHLLDFNKNIYDHPIRVNFIQRLRAEKKFDSIQALSDQIHKDIEQAQVILAGVA
ncbi:MAG: bifunctional riboflavin kinase/FAD synthetase [Desulfosarcinaceae bacterium]